MSEMGAFIRLGLMHITDLQGMDHILFLFALAAIYRPRDWRDALWVVTAFTVGHSITLALAVTGAIRLPTPLIEFLIPITIVATCIENIVVRSASGRRGAVTTDRSLRASSVSCTARALRTTFAISSPITSPCHSSDSTSASSSDRSSCSLPRPRCSSLPIG